MSNDSRVKIVAIAKDEGAYIAEWVFHHLYFGFDAIDIYVNRTSDNTCDILDVISKEYPHVSYTYIDWIEMHKGAVAKRMQHIIYSQAYSEEKKKKNFSHILFIDIDEFWTPLNFRDSIHECLSSMPTHTCISFQWFNVLGEENKFQYMTKSINGFYQPLVKSICATDAEVEEMKLHLPIFYNNENFKGYFLSNGSVFVHSKNDHQIHNFSNEKSVRPYIIVHRMFRSEIEYISLLYRGNPENHDRIKLNRQQGFLRKSDNQEMIEFNDSAYKKYSEKREIFFKKLQIDDKLNEAKRFIEKRAQSTLEILPKELIENYQQVSKVLQGLSIPQVVDICENMKNKNKQMITEVLGIFEKNDNKTVVDKIKEKQQTIVKNIQESDTTADVLRDIALLFEKEKDIELAYIIMKEAFHLREHGPKIQYKLQEYKRILKQRKHNA